MQHEGGGARHADAEDIRGAAPGVLAGNVDNISQVYSAYAGPTVATHAGPIALGASYRIGYTKVDTPEGVNDTGGEPGARPVRPVAQPGRAGQRGGEIGRPTAGGRQRQRAVAARRRDSARSAFRRQDGAGRPGAAGVADGRADRGVGYEKIDVSQRDPVKDIAGDPVVDTHGRFVTDKASPRRIAYQTDGLIYDAG